MPKILDITGERFGRLVALERRPDRKWICQCDCGNKTAVNVSHLRNGSITSCKCYMLERISETHGTHFMCDTTEYQIWKGIKVRCFTKSHHSYQSYGSRGITMCEEWANDFEVFLRDMGKRPSKNHSIDRIDVNGNYEPSNCRWATKKQQARNKNATGKALAVGVTVHAGGKFRVRIIDDTTGKRVHVGLYDTIEEAILARKEAEKKYWKESV